MYGTLKRNGSNFERYCTGVSRVDDAVVWGRLYGLPQGYPILDIPQSQVLAHGTADPSNDIARQERRTVPPAGLGVPCVSGGSEWRRIHGELLELEDGERILPMIDALEDFHSEGPALYRRVLVAADRYDNQRVAAWLYVLPEDAGGRYPPIDADTWSE